MAKPKHTSKSKKSTEVQDLKELAQRTQANFENYRKQTEKRIEEIRDMASRNILSELLPIVDNFELALKNTGNVEEFQQGVELIYSQLTKLLQDNNLEQIATENETFDPHLHEALMKVPSDKPEGTIVEEFQKGFILNGKVIRRAKVKISNGEAN